MTKVKGSSQHAMSGSRPERVSWRIRHLSQPKRRYVDVDMEPEITPRGVRKSALRAECPDRIVDMSVPLLWRLDALRKQYSHRFAKQRLEQINTLMELGNQTMYTKLANSAIDIKRAGTKRAKAWTESEWKKHMDHISPLANPKQMHSPKKPRKKKWKPLPQLLPRIKTLALVPDFKIYKRYSQEDWYRDPTKVKSSALQYVISDRMKLLAKPRESPP